ncbi:replication-relaxation family protein [Cytobacillus sp. FJAT-53684]|uniref:Replication-relaxation family protein n=1 Tax=Cytobacillus mangrovibacter TaxID=3299024 RepID=A0ABW6K3T9_9BACI
MILWRNNRISNKQQQILTLIYQYRGLTNEHLRKLIFGHLDSNQAGQKANISRYTSELRNTRMIESFSCYPYSQELIHCLTSKGIEFVQEQVQIDQENKLAGFKDQPYGDFSATMLKPGLKNLEHTMMYLDFATKFRKKLDIRHNLFAVQEYLYFNKVSTNSGYYKNGKVRPDGEILFNQHILFTLEIDTGSERLEQLTAKFENYQKYLEYCMKHEVDSAWEGLLFVCKHTELSIEKDQRLHTILRAIVAGLGYYCWIFSVQIYRGEGIVLSQLFQEQEDLFRNLGIAIPSKENPILIEKRQQEREKQREEEERKRLAEEAQRKVEERIRQERLANDRKKRLEEEQRTRELEEEERKKKRFYGVGKFFS